jgi:hypothetical protein
MENDAKSRKNPAAVALGRLGGLKGGAARAKMLTAVERNPPSLPPLLHFGAASRFDAAGENRQLAARNLQNRGAGRIQFPLQEFPADAIVPET